VIPTGTFCLATDPPEQGSCSTFITSSRRHWENKRTKWNEQRQKPVDVSKMSHIYVTLFMVHFTFSAWAGVLNTF